MDVARRSFTLIVLAGVVLSCEACAFGGMVAGHALQTSLRMGVRQEVNGSVYQAVGAVKDALRELELPVTCEHSNRSGVEICSKYQSHRVWVEIRDRSAETSRIDVRVKWPTGDKDAARRILDVIMRRLSVPR